MKRYRLRIVKKVNHLMKFMGTLNKCDKKKFNKYCEEKEVNLWK